MWSLLIKLNIYKEAIKLIDPFILHQKINFREDSILLENIIQISKTFKFSNILGMLIIIRKNSASRSNYNELKFENFFYINHLYNLIRAKNISFNPLVEFILESVQIKQSERVLDFGVVVLDKIMNNSNLEKHLKEKLRKLYFKLIKNNKISIKKRF